MRRLFVVESIENSITLGKGRFEKPMLPSSREQGRDISA